MPLDMLKFQWEQILKHVSNWTIDGYSILAACLIDGQPEQARWVRDFIRIELNRDLHFGSPSGCGYTQSFHS